MTRGGGRIGWRPYGLAIVASLAAALADQAPATADRPALWTFLSLAAIVAAAAAGGLRPALLGLAMALVYGAGPLHAGALALAGVAALGAAIALLAERGRRVRHRAREAAVYLREREVHIQSILDAAPDGLVVFDAGGTVRAFSAAAERQFGWTAAEVIGADVAELMPEARRLALASDLEPRTMTGARRDGSRFALELTLADSGRGERRFFTAFVRDLDEAADAGRLEAMRAELRQVSRLTAMGEMAGGAAGEHDAIGARLAQLSARERQVLEGLVAGHANKAIAFDLSISPRTVEIYRAKLMAKMKARSLPELVRMALVADA